MAHGAVPTAGIIRDDNNMGRPSPSASVSGGKSLETLLLSSLAPRHEIYLTDPNRVAPEKTKTVLRQPVRSSG